MISETGHPLRQNALDPGFIAFQLGRVPFQAVRGAAAERDFMGE